MLKFKVEREKCTSCGLCVEDCPAGIIASVDEIPDIAPEREEACFRCQHCISICPTGAISIFGLDPASLEPLRGGFPEPEKLSLLMRGRRSVRHYQRENVDKNVLADLLAVASSAPSGMNARKVLFTLVDDLETMDRLRETTYAKIEELNKIGKIPPGYEFYADFVKLWRESGVDVLYRGAPHIIFASAPRDAASPEADCTIALAYFELYAASLGLGAVWDGLAKIALNIVAPQLSGKLGVPHEHVLVYALAFGKPAVSYRRAAKRATYKINRPKL